MLPKKELTKEEKKQYLLQKYVKREKFDIEEIKKFAVFWRPMTGDANQWILITVCDSLPQAKEEIRWRAEYHKTNDGDLVLDHDKRFITFRDETLNKDKNGKTIEPEDIQFDGGGNVKSMGDMVNLDNVSRNASLFEALPKPQGKFKSMAYYQGIELEYRGYYKIDEIYDVTD